MFAPAALLNPVSRRLHFTIHQSLSTSAIPQESLCNRRFLPSPQPSPCKGEGGEGASPQPSPCKGEGGEGASLQPSPCKGEGAINAQELLWLCTRSHYFRNAKPPLALPSPCQK